MSISSPKMSLAMAALAAKSATTLFGGGGGGGLVSKFGTDPDGFTASAGLIEWSLFMGVQASHPGGSLRSYAHYQNTGWQRAYDRATVKVLPADGGGFAQDKRDALPDLIRACELGQAVSAQPRTAVRKSRSESSDVASPPH